MGTGAQALNHTKSGWTVSKRLKTWSRQPLAQGAVVILTSICYRLGGSNSERPAAVLMDLASGVLVPVLSLMRCSTSNNLLGLHCKKSLMVKYVVPTWCCQLGVSTSDGLDAVAVALVSGGPN